MLQSCVKHAIAIDTYTQEMEQETMGDRIRYLRIAKQLSQKQLGDLLGITEGAISQWENDRVKNVKLETLEVLLKVLGVSLTYLIHGSGRAGRSLPPSSAHGDGYKS